MNSLAKAITRRIFGRIDRSGDLAKLPSVYRNAGGGGLMSRIMAAGLLRLALRWPGLSIVVLLLVIAARLVARRERKRAGIPPLPQARG